jgi:hypothetical protein
MLKPFIVVVINKYFICGCRKSFFSCEIILKYNFNRRFAHKVMGFQNRGNFETSTWESRDKITFGCWSCDKVYYKGEGGGFPQVWAVMSLVSLCLPMVHSCTKSVPAIH